jgi:DNA repair protein RecO (recombination protein O)
MRYRCEAGAGPLRLGVAEGDQGISGEALLGLAAGTPLSGKPAREARALMRGLLAPHLGPRPLKSRELFRRSRPLSKAYRN